MEPNRAALVSAVQLEQPVDSPIYAAGQESTAADKPVARQFQFPVLRQGSSSRVRFADAADWLD